MAVFTLKKKAHDTYDESKKGIVMNSLLYLKVLNIYFFFYYHGKFIWFLNLQAVRAVVSGEKNSRYVISTCRYKSIVSPQYTYIKIIIDYS